MDSSPLDSLPSMGAVGSAAEVLDGVVRPVGAGPIILVVLLIAARCGPPT